MRNALSDLRTAARSLTRRPGHALSVSLTLALGISATTSIYGVVDGVMLRPLPYEDAGTLVVVGGVQGGLESVGASTEFQNLLPLSSVVVGVLRERSRSFQGLAAVQPYRVSITGENQEQQFIRAAHVSAELFTILGVSPVLGRLFRYDEFLPGQTDAVILSYRFWQARYGGDLNVLGRTLDGATTPQGIRPTIVGVLPRGFSPPEALFPEGESPEIYEPLVLATREVRLMQTDLGVLGRLTPGTTLEQARAELDGISVDLAAESPTIGTLVSGGATGVSANYLHAETVGNVGRTLWVFLGAAALLLLLALMNAATLLLARGLDRRQELGVRVALGAGRARMVQALLAEATLLSLLGGLVGVVLALAAIEVFVRVAPPSIPRVDAVAVDGRVLIVAVVATLITAVGAGVLPALGLTRGSVWNSLQSGGRATSESKSHLRTALVGGQLALAMMLLCGAGLLFISFLRLRAADPGFEPDGLLVMSPTAPPRIYTRGELLHERWDEILLAQAAVPGVRSVAGASGGLPFQEPQWAPRIRLPGEGAEVLREGIAGYAITPRFFETAGVEILRGRGFEPGDSPTSERVAIVNEAFARVHLDGRDALGEMVIRDVQRMAVGAVPEPMSLRVVGVVEDVVQARVADGPRPAIYIPYTQADAPQLYTWWSVVRADLPQSVVIPALRGSVEELGARLDDITTMSASIARTEVTPRFQTLLLTTFAGIATVLAALGLYGSLSQTVRRRRREIGIRMALGADRASVLRTVMGQGMRLSLIGILIGLAGTLALNRVLAAFLFGMASYDPPTLLGVSATLLLICAVACLAPVRRAAGIDPVRVLHEP